MSCNPKVKLFEPGLRSLPDGRVLFHDSCLIDRHWKQEVCVKVEHIRFGRRQRCTSAIGPGAMPANRTRRESTDASPIPTARYLAPVGRTRLSVLCRHECYEGASC